ncbi:Ankyrin-3 [Colletotrichum tropicale]|nr:Ankyrin-3 [Colletotrichum tropicale]
MSASRKLLFFFILLFARAMAADGGDDFANNLFSDLGPLLALFGERVTMQFMSGSMGWADNIILAMAPLGIITAIVGAIRVGAPSWLKAVIGRARENLAVAEAELMSSTSQEVCELWNGQEVVRCMGSPSVTEFICLLPTTEKGSQRNPEIKVDKNLSALDDHDKDLEPVGASITIQLKTVLGTMTTLTGFVLQFVGLRGLHWSASVAQLGAVFLMVCLKAWVRRGLATPPKAISLPPGYELDWFAKTLGNVDEAPWNNNAKPGTGLVRKLNLLSRIIDRKSYGFEVTQNGVKKSSEGGFNSSWRIANTGDAHLGRQQRSKSQVNAHGEEQSQDKSDAAVPMVSDAQAVLNIRKDLGHLAKWSGPASAEAVSLARAIEITMNTLIGSKPIESDSIDSASAGPASVNVPPNYFMDVPPIVTSPPPHDHSPIGLDSPLTFYWSLDACYGGFTHHPVNFQLQRQADGKWKAFANEYEAVLSLWLSSVNDGKQKTAKLPKIGERPGDKINREDDARLRMEESNGELGLRLLGLHTAALHQNLRWWVPKDLLRIFEVQEHEQSQEPQDPQQHRYHQDDNQEHVFEVETHRVIGYGQQKVCLQDARDEIKKNQNSFQFSRKDLPEDTTDEDDDEIAEDTETNTVLATESYSSMPMLFAQHIFSAFMYAVAGKGKKIKLFQDAVDVQPNTSGESTWKSFTLRNATLSAMVSEIESSGLGSLADIYLIVIPPLSENHKLPQADDAIIEMARKKARQYEQLKHWEEATKIYVWLFRTANTHRERGIITKATAVLMEYLRQISSAIDLMEGEVARSFEPLKESKESIEKELNGSADHQVLLSLMELYARQGRGWKCAAICKQDARTSRAGESKQLEEFNFTYLQREVLLRNYINVYGAQRSDLNASDIHSWTLLHYAARIRNWTGIYQLIEAGANVNSIDVNGYTPLHYACQYSMEVDRDAEDRERTINQLIRGGADVNSQGRDGMAPLHYASMEGNEDVASMLIVAGANIDITDASGSTPLIWAVRKGALGCVQSLWKISNKRLRDNQGRTALHLAALNGMADVVEWLITKGGADKEARDLMKYRPLHWAASNGHKKIVDLLINKGAEKDAKTPSGFTPLHCAAEYGHTHVLALLLKHGLGINERYKLGGTALHKAAYNGNEEVVALLLQQGADKDAQYPSGYFCGITPLHQAAEKGHEKVVALLIQHGANPDAKDETAMTPLHKASQEGHEDVVKLLIKLQVDIEARYTLERYSDPEKSGSLTPFHCAAAHGHAHIVKILMDAGAKTDVLDKDEPSRLALAVQCGHAEIAKQLIENGSDVNEQRNMKI